jgi:hypothetical protein
LPHYALLHTSPQELCGPNRQRGDVQFFVGIRQLS